jgi:hypothetical protein
MRNVFRLLLEGERPSGPPKSTVESLTNVLLESDVISLIARVLVFPVSDELDALPISEKCKSLTRLLNG